MPGHLFDASPRLVQPVQSGVEKNKSHSWFWVVVGLWSGSFGQHISGNIGSPFAWKTGIVSSIPSYAQINLFFVTTTDSRSHFNDERVIAGAKHMKMMASYQSLTVVAMIHLWLKYHISWYKHGGRVERVEVCSNANRRMLCTRMLVTDIISAKIHIHVVIINTHRGLYWYNLLPFRVAFAPAIFQKMMGQVLQGLLKVICYLDDILVSLSSGIEHLEILNRIHQRL